jgi:thioredoxin-like negative regulator of GroEL
LALSWLSGCAHSSRAEARATFAAPAEVVELPPIEKINNRQSTRILSGTEFEQSIERIDPHGTVLLVFTGAHCPACKRCAEAIGELKGYSERSLLHPRADTFAMHEIDFDLNAALAGELGVEKIPCFIIYRDGKETERIYGVHSREEILDCLK